MVASFSQHDAGTLPANRPRFRVLVTQDRTHADEHWTRQLPRLLATMGVDAQLMPTGEDAYQCMTQQTIHAAVVDIATPIGASTPSSTLGGLWLLERVQRLPIPPSVVLVNSRNWSQAEIARALHEALRLHAFAVVNAPVQMDTLLQTFRRLLELRWKGQWPTQS